MRRGYVFRLIAFLALSLSAPGLHAEQSQDFGDYVVHFNAIGTVSSAAQSCQGIQHQA